MVLSVLILCRGGGIGRVKFMDLRFGSIVVSIICSVVFKLFSCMGNGDIGTYVPF